MDHYQLSCFEIKDADNNNAVILVTGSLRYKTILERAFAPRYFSRTFIDNYGRFDWGTYIYNTTPEEIQKIQHLLTMFQDGVCIEDDLTECFALGYHSQISPLGTERSELGGLVYQAKPYRGDFTQARKNAANIAVERLKKFILTHPTYEKAELIAAVPPSRPNLPNLPIYLVEQLAQQLNKQNGTQLIQKLRTTLPMKDCKTIKEKIENLKGAFALYPQANVTQKRIILIDDIYQTGFTLNEVGRVFVENGAETLGLVVTKTMQDITD